ncbi:MAG: hypothetical protein HYX67_16125 [Candidatus Melainabacteria bacterium]|nr:hypothetical protein [Candidatus Melainabacteria bacterium]
MGKEAVLNHPVDAQTLHQEASHHSADESQPSSLWQSAYEHPIAAGLGVTAIAGAALYLSRGRIANLLAPSSQEVLLVEAAPFMGKAMRHSLEEAGHRVTWVTEIDKLRPLTGLTESGAEVPLKMGRFHTAFIDPNHVTKGAIGFDKLAPFFHRGNVRTIGTSVMSDVNAHMLADGVDIAAKKTTVLMSLIGKNLNLQEAVRAPGRTQAVLSNLEEKINTTELAGLRQQTSELITRFAVN